MPWRDTSARYLIGAAIRRRGRPFPLACDAAIRSGGRDGAARPRPSERRRRRLEPRFGSSPVAGAILRGVEASPRLLAKRTAARSAAFRRTVLHLESRGGPLYRHR